MCCGEMGGRGACVVGEMCGRGACVVGRWAVGEHVLWGDVR